MRRASLIVGVILGMSSTSYAQSLADVAKKTAEQREAKKVADQKKADEQKPAEKKSEATATPKVFTNKDLAPVSTPTVTATPTAGATQSATLSTDVTKEPYWRERRRAFNAKLHEDMAADKAALDLFLLMEKTGIMRRDPAAYVKAIAEMKRTSEVV